MLVGAVLLVMIVELLNSGIEAAIDRVSFELHDLSKRAKDLASAAVFLSLVLCGVWGAALWHQVLAEPPVAVRLLRLAPGDSRRMRQRRDKSEP